MMRKFKVRIEWDSELPGIGLTSQVDILEVDTFKYGSLEKFCTRIFELWCAKYSSRDPGTGKFNDVIKCFTLKGGTYYIVIADSDRGNHVGLISATISDDQ